MILYRLYQHRRGEKILMMIDSLRNVNARVAQLRTTGKVNGDRVTYTLERAKDGDRKFRRKSHNYNPSGDGSSPRLVKHGDP